MQNTSKNNRKYLLLCHLIFVTKYRRNIFNHNALEKYLLDYIRTLERNFKIIDLKTDKNHIHFLIEYEPNISISQIVRHLKQLSTVELWKKYGNILNVNYWKEHTLWSDGYFVCSIGNSNPETIKNYIKNQG
jgi:putative transposase